MRPLICVLYLIFCYYNHCLGQHEDSQNEFFQVEESYANQADNHIHETANLLLLKRNPINLNETHAEELKIFHWISDAEIQRIMHYIENHHPLISVLELQSITGISLDGLRKMVPYLTVREKDTYSFSWRKFIQEGEKSITFRWSRALQDDASYSLSDSVASAYVGSPDKLFLRFRTAKTGQFSMGIIAEKDPGEILIRKSIHSKIDYVSAHIFVEKVNSGIRSLAIGDYALSLGQGLLLNNSFYTNKSSQFGFMVKNSSLLRPYNSLLENNMFRGVATKLSLAPSWQALLFYSAHKIDANGTSSPEEQEVGAIENFSSFQTSGLHRNQSEREDQNILPVQHIGGSVQKNKGRLQFGFNFFQQKLAFDRELDLKRIDQVFFSNDRTSYFFSIHHQAQYKNVSFFGELASDHQFHHALLEGLIVSLGKKAETILVYRNYHPGYQSYLSNSISVSGNTNNERGLMLGINLYPSRHWTWTLFADQWTHPWLRYQIDIPIQGAEYNVRVAYTKRKKWNAYLQYSYKIRNETYLKTGNQSKINSVTQTTHQQFRVHFEQKLSAEWIWRSRLEWHFLTQNERIPNGFLIYSDLIYKSFVDKFSGTFRVALFNASDYGTRIYAFENDLLYQFSIPAYYGSGVRMYVNLRRNLGPMITAELRWAGTHYSD
ncbi:MAG: helix-hairpin-helix domain-containing protein, partial [Bacteroidota bacterium]|nr:helix-hairpin-helix domain-containing protein [Bacteroidota bacterium]